MLLVIALLIVVFMVCKLRRKVQPTPRLAQYSDIFVIFHVCDFLIFIARQHTAADARYWYSNSARLSVCPSVRLSVRLSVRDTLVLYENGLTYRHSFSTIR